MPIFLRVPTHKPSGPDGQGWNRYSLGSLAGDECALLPRDYTHLRESLDTRIAHYGGFGPCTEGGKCETCPVFQAPPMILDAFDDRVLVRINPNDSYAHLMNRAEDGWASLSHRWTWPQLARLEGWEIGRRFSDEHSECFWLTRMS